MDNSFDPQHTAEENENFLLAHKYMNMYAESLVDEYKVKKENAFLLTSLDRITNELTEIKGEIAEVKEQNKTITEGFRYLELTRMTIGLGGGSLGEGANIEDVLSRLTGSMAQSRSTMPPTGEPPPNERMPRYRTEEPRRRQLNVGALSRDREFLEMFGRPQPTDEASLNEVSLDERRLNEPPPQPQAHPPDEPTGEPLLNEPPIDEPSTTVRPTMDVGEHPPEIPGRRDETREPETAQPIPATPAAPVPPPAEAERKKNKTASVISNVLFYLCMVLLVLGAVAFSQSDNVNKSIFGFRYYYIKSASMVPVYPVGSMVITKVVEPQEIKVGDDVTVYVGDDSSDTYLTHRVVEITTDSAGEPAFRTRGVNNKSNDPAPFNAKLVVGKVVLCIPGLGLVMTFVRSQLWLVIGIFVLLLALSFMLRLLFTKETPPTQDSSKPQKAVKEPKPPKAAKPPKEPKPPKPPKSRGKFMRRAEQTTTQ